MCKNIHALLGIWPELPIKNIITQISKHICRIVAEPPVLHICTVFSTKILTVMWRNTIFEDKRLRAQLRTLKTLIFTTSANYQSWMYFVISSATAWVFLCAQGFLSDLLKKANRDYDEKKLKEYTQTIVSITRKRILFFHFSLWHMQNYNCKNIDFS